MSNNDISYLADKSISELINQAVPKFSVPIIKSQIDKYTSLKLQTEKNLYKNFLSNSQEIIQVLNSYNEIIGLSDTFEKNKQLFNKSLHFLNNKEKVFVDAIKQQKLKKIFTNFCTPMDYFIGDRQLIHFEKFDNQILVLTNDLLFVGALQSNGYELTNVLNYKVITAKQENDLLKIRTEKEELVFKKDFDSVQKICDLVEEFNFEPAEVSNNSSDIEEEFVYTANDFKKSGLPAKIDFLIFSYKSGLYKINQVCETKIFLENVFNFFWQFIDEQELLVDKPISSFLVENELLILFSYIKKRVFFNFSTSKIKENFLMVKSKLKRGRVDLRGFIGNLVNEEDVAFENAKERISVVIDELKSLTVDLN